ncbi:MAG: Ig-like domain-containing protein [Gemmatimonadota bacterium]|nr:Ig-like domain-containing protein [Gemmatimonadota bacterium]
MIRRLIHLPSVRPGSLAGFALAASLLVSLAGCDDPTGVAVASVEVTAPSSVLTAGRSLQLTPTVRDAGGAVRSGRVSWLSSDPLLAVVDSTGLVRGLNPGRVRITATSGGKTGEVELTITMIASVAIRVHADSLFAGRSYAIVAETRDTGGFLLGGTPVAWSSSDTLTARVVPPSDQNRQATLVALKPGEVTLTAVSEGMKATARYVVQPSDRVAVQPIASAPFAMSIPVGGSTRLSASVLDVNSRAVASRPITWSSSDPAVISVDSSGVIRGVARGAATITASAEGARSGSVVVRVERGYLATPLSIDAMDLNDTGQVAGTEHVPGAGHRPVVWDRGRIVWTGPVATVFRMVINNSGHVAGTWIRRPGERTRGFVWKGGDVLEIVPQDSTAYLHVTGMTGQGQVVGHWFHSGTPTTGNAFLWEDGKLTDLGRFGGTHALANGINDRGQLLVTVMPQGRVLLVEDGKAADVASGEGVFIGNGGEVIVYQGDNALIRRNGELVQFTAGRHQSFRPREINSRGEVVGIYTSPIQAFLWKEGHFFHPKSLTLNAPDYGFSQAVAINERGQILVRADRYLLLTPAP